MPGSMPPLDLSRQIADLMKRIQRLERVTAAPSGFDPNADPVVIGSGANGHSVTAGVAVGASANVTASRGVAVGNSSNSQAADSIAIGSTAHTDSTATESVAIGYNAESVGPYNAVYGPNAFANATAQYGVALGYNALCEADSSTALGSGADAAFTNSTAVGVNAVTTKANQIMLGTDAEFVEIPGNSSTAPNGLVLTDTATSTRYIIRITSGALVLSAAP